MKCAIIAALAGLAAATPAHRPPKRSPSAANTNSTEKCTANNGLTSDGAVAWYVDWAWSGSDGEVKWYPDAVVEIEMNELSAIPNIPSQWTWTDDIVANVACDLFTSSTDGGDYEYEVLIWLDALGGAGLISATAASSPPSR
ncbi:hypothetical protein G7Z17_g4939 [Cylindrodendrum hubeiense]|uniref:Uncharacterized protein n=1 Tax=Cylindrodendrum hubeiense TaxID=595255 RepID=A0A9P5H7S3_9HYPO|nr:hypothetical protein G7Z17_g4939 [Cylindrodendrum hubeiense]